MLILTVIILYFILLSIKTSKCSRNCNNINDPYARICVPDIGEYLDYSNCKCRKELFDKLNEERTENIDEVKIDHENENENKYNFSIVYNMYIVLFSIILVISIVIGIYFVYSHWHLKKDIPRVKFSTRTQTTI